jgi:hypothetical protein
MRSEKSARRWLAPIRRAKAQPSRDSSRSPRYLPQTGFSGRMSPLVSILWLLLMCLPLRNPRQGDPVAPSDQVGWGTERWRSILALRFITTNDKYLAQKEFSDKLKTWELYANVIKPIEKIKQFIHNYSVDNKILLTIQSISSFFHLTTFYV